MKTLLAFFIILVLIPVLVLGGVFGMVYIYYIDPQPTIYESVLKYTAEDITAIECARIVVNESIDIEGGGTITDIEGFWSEFKNVECHYGINFGDLKNVANDKYISVMIVLYADGHHEYITPYFCYNSNEKIETIDDVFAMKITGFNPKQFNDLLVKYGVEINEDSFNNLEDLIPQT